MPIHSTQDCIGFSSSNTVVKFFDRYKVPIFFNLRVATTGISEKENKGVEYAVQKKVDFTSMNSV